MRRLRAIAEAMESHAGRPFLIDGATAAARTYADVDARARALADGLRAAGLQRGDRLAVAMPNSVPLAELYLGALYSGVVVAPLSPALSHQRASAVLRLVAPHAIFVEGGTGAAEAAARAGIEAFDLDGLAATAPSGWQPFDSMSDDDVVAIHTTSGSTGEPRAIHHRVRDFVANAERYGAATGIDADLRFHCALPMTYMAGYHNLLMVPLLHGASVVIDRAVDAQGLVRFWDVPRQCDVSALWLVPALAAMLLRVDRGRVGADLCREQIRFAAIGTAPLDPALREKFEATYGVVLHENYGLSETLFVTTSTPEHPAAPGSVGRALEGVEIDLRGDAGEVWIRTPDLMVGQDGWFATGDLGTMDADGALRITGRTKDVIIRGGVNISAPTVERVLERHDDVDRVAVVGLPHDLLGEEVVAVVSTAPGVSMDELEPALRGLAKESLGATEAPGTYIAIDELPVTPTGKVRKAALRDLLIDRLGLSQSAKGFVRDVAARNGVNGLRPPTRLIDLSRPLREGMTTYPSPNHPRFEMTQLARHHLEGRETRRVVIGTHTGTHLDAPRHFVPGGATVDMLDLDLLVGQASVLDVRPIGPLEAIDVERLEHVLGGRALLPRVLLRTGWADRFDSLDFYTQAPYLTADACAWLLERGVRLLGTDLPSPDDPRNGFGTEQDSPNHVLLLGAGVILVEYLHRLEEITGDEVELMALPLPLSGADGAPARVVIREPAT